MTIETPIDGYLYFYETRPLKLSIKLHESLEAGFAVQSDDLSNSQLASQNVSGFQGQKVFTSRGDKTPSKCDAIVKSRETSTDFDPDDISIVTSCTQNEVLKILKSLNVSFDKGTTTARLNNILKNKLQLDHPIHEFLKALDI